jgi:hypothetical protein
MEDRFRTTTQEVSLMGRRGVVHNPLSSMSESQARAEAFRLNRSAKLRELGLQAAEGKDETERL